MLQESWELLISLVKGMAITLRQMFVRPFTVQYPDQRVTWPDRTRGRLVMPRDAVTQTNRCTACLTCERICPNGSIEIKVRTNESNRKVLEDFVFHLERCTFCGLCVEACPFDALRMSHEHEIAVRDRRTLTLHLQQETLTFNPAWRGGLPAKADKEKHEPQGA